jgi:hypothetical protein
MWRYTRYVKAIRSCLDREKTLGMQLSSPCYAPSRGAGTGCHYSQAACRYLAEDGSLRWLGE